MRRALVHSRVMHNVWEFRLLFGWHAMPNAWILHNIVDGNNDDFLGVFSIENNRYFVYLFCLSCAPKRWGYWIFFFWANCLLLLLHRFLFLAWYFKRFFYFCQYSLQCRNCFPFLVAKKFCASISIWLLFCLKCARRWNYNFKYQKCILCMLCDAYKCFCLWFVGNFVTRQTLRYANEQFSVLRALFFFGFLRNFIGFAAHSLRLAYASVCAKFQGAACEITKQAPKQMAFKVKKKK